MITKKKKRKSLIIATDLDGTLLSSDTSVSYENMRAIRTLDESGIKVALLTGRTLYEIPKELRCCSHISYLVYSNGAGINAKIKGIVDYHPIERGTAQKIFDILREYETFIEIYSNGFPFVEESKFSREYFDYYRIDDSFIPEMYKSRRCTDSLSALLDDESYKTEMFNVFFRNCDERIKCTEKINRLFPSLEYTTSMQNNIEITKHGINKGSGLVNLSKVSKTSLENIIVVGDSKNDLAAFEKAVRKYAVQNACAELKKAADKIICSNDENIMQYFTRELNLQ